MEKEIYTSHISREGMGCVWVFMSMFDLRHGGANNHKLLMDKKRGSKRIITGIDETKVEKQLTCDCEKSVKKLIEEEIDEKTHQKCDTTECRGKIKAINVLRAGHADDQCPRTSQSDDDSEEKFSELIKRLIAQKESDEVESCKNLVDDSNEELFLNSSPGTQQATRNKAKSGSRFTLSRIRRRIKKSAKNPCNASHESDQDPDALSSNMSQTSCLGEEIETSSGRHVSDGEILPEANKEDGEGSKKSMCGIYIAAKKHLSEMLAEGGMSVDSPDKEVPRILGKILALPQFSTPENSPKMTLAHDFVAHQITEKPKIHQCSSEDHSGLDMPVPGGVSPCSPPRSSVKMSECQENATDVPGKSSPVSVLEPFFTDDDTSPSTSRFSSVEMRLKPLCIRFDEPDSPRPDKDNNIKTGMDEKELALAYIQDVVASSELNWEELLFRSFYSEQVLEQALMDEIDFCSTNVCNDKKLLFDCINEVLMEFCRHGPWVSLAKPAVRFCPDMDNAAEVVQEEVYWHLLPFPSPHTLDQIVRKDMVKSGCWMDLHFDIGCIGSQTGDTIFDELLDEIIISFRDLFQSTNTSMHKLIH